ncbi:TM1812 family CRISPR-associated protein [Treponema sp.]|uniref:TM1812 family CRISPR-associated protein n=1 Tax=Treponema sp. TaxID=166 RepID=UPI003FD7CC03
MNKIVFVSLMMADAMNKRKYPVDGNSFIEYENEVYYAINAVLAKTMKSDDDVKVILLETKAGEKAGSKNAQLFMNELNEINSKVNANVTYEVIPSDFITSKDKFNDLYLKLIKNFSYEAELYADITFGPKSLPLLIFSAMQFGEKFFDCSIGNVIYLKAEFKNNVLVEGTQLICDYTPLYLLNSFTNTIESSSGEKVIKAVETLFED